MNKEQVNGAVKNVTGKTQEEIGKLIGSESQQIRGIEKQIEGKFEEKIGDLKQAIQDLKHGK